LGDQSGSSVSLSSDGTRIAIAAPFNDGAGDNAGHVRIYNVGGENSASDNIEVFALPAVTFTAAADLCIDAGIQSGLGSGTATGGVYSGTG
jgi:hypothetical protein